MQSKTLRNICNIEAHLISFLHQMNMIPNADSILAGRRGKTAISLKEIDDTIDRIVAGMEEISLAIPFVRKG
ncbi:hypothetical protein LINPERHAP2_LOCUS27849 [Linum perenne]